jgi:DNA-3-methyladenine glycosylase
MTQDDFRNLAERDVLAASHRLLGGILRLGELSARIVEVEAYRGLDDAGCHAYNRRGPKCETMYGRPGHAYVYFTYGNHWMLNLVALPVDLAGAILIRAAEPLTGFKTMQERRKQSDLRQLLSGPGKLCQALGIDRRFDNTDLLGADELSIEIATKPVTNMVTGTRIGLAVGKGDELPWRFIDGDRMTWISRPLPKPLART